MVKQHVDGESAAVADANRRKVADGILGPGYDADDVGFSEFSVGIIVRFVAHFLCVDGCACESLYRAGEIGDFALPQATPPGNPMLQGPVGSTPSLLVAIGTHAPHQRIGATDC